MIEPGPPRAQQVPRPIPGGDDEGERADGQQAERQRAAAPLGWGIGFGHERIRVRVLGELPDEIAEHLVGVEPDLGREVPDERAQEDPAGQPLRLVLLERLQVRHGNLGHFRDRAEVDAALLAGVPQPGAHQPWGAAIGFLGSAISSSG